MNKVYSGYEIELNKEEDKAYKAKILKIEGNSYQETRDEVAGTTVSGDFISISDAQDLPITKFNIEGKSVQETREGYNHFNAGNLNLTNTTQMSQNWQNDVLTVTSAGLPFALASQNITDLVKNNPGKTLTFDFEEITFTQVDVTKSSPIQMNIYFSDGTATKYWSIVDYQKIKHPYTIPTDTSNISSVLICVYSWNGTGNDSEFTTTVKKPMLYLGAEEKEYERYGKTPSIEFKAPIESVGDNINEYNANATFPINSNGLTITKDDDGSITINGTATANVNCVIGTVPLTTINEMNGKEYALSLEESGTGSVSNTGLKHNGNDRFVVSSSYPTKTGVFTKIDTDTRDYSWALWIISGTVFTNYNLKLKLSKGTSTGAYSPYGQGSVEVKQVNKNQFKVTATTKTVNGITFTVNEDGTILVNGTSTADTSFLVQELTAYKTGEYILSDEANGSGTTYFTRLYRGSSGYDTIAQTTSGTAKFLLNEDTEFRTYILIKPNTTLNNILFKPMIRLASDIDDTYVEHQSQTKTLYTQQPFRAIGDVKDRFVKQNGVWYEEHNVEEKIYTGNENWEKRNSLGDSYTRFGTTSSYGLNAIGFCDKLKVLSNVNWANQEEKVDIDNSSISITVKKDRLDTDDVAGFKNFLLSNNITIYAKLKEPLLIPCTPEQVEVLESMRTYEGVNHIYTTDELKPTISLRYNYIPALPSLDEESKAESVGNNKQLLNKNTITDGIFILLGNGKEQKNTVWSQSDFIQVKPKGVYSAYNLETINNVSWIEVSEYDEEKKWIKSEQRGSKGNKGTTFTVGRTTSYIRLGYRNDVGLIDLKLSEGEKITTYSPFGQGSLKITHLNGNLVDMEKIKWRTNTNGTYEYISNNEIKVNAKSGTYSGIYTNEIAIQDFRKPVVISFEMKADQNCKVYVGTAGVDRKTIELTLEYKRFVLKDIGKNSTGAIVFYGLNLPTDLSFYIKNLMISYEESEFIPHQSKEILLPIQEPFRKNGNVTDIFVKKNDRWYEQHNIIRHVFDGTEVFQANVEWNTASPEIYHAFFKPTNWKIGQRNAVSNYFDFVIQTERDMNAEQIYCSTTNASPYLFIKTERLADEKTTTDNINTYLTELNKQGKPMYLEYEAETPVLIPCTPQQSTILDQLENIQLYDGVNYIYTIDEIQPLLTLEIYNMIEDYDLYVSNDGYFGIPGTDIKFLVNFHESNLPTMPEAVEASVRAAGRDGDYVLNTTYEPLPFEIVCYTEDNLTPTQKKEIESKVNRFLNSIKNRTKRISFEKGEKFYNVKYNGLLTTTNYPAHLKFSIPLKSSESFGKDAYQKVLSGNSTEVSDTVEEVGALITINGPATLPIIALNDYSMEYDTAILEGARVEIDTAKSTATHINSDGVKTNVMRYYNHQFPKIQPGENTLKVLSGVDDENNVTVKWNDLKL